MTTLFVSPVERVSAQGREKQTYSFYDTNTKSIQSTGKPMKSTRASGAGVRLNFVSDWDRMQLKTGLDEMVQNPYQHSDDPNIPQNIKDATRISKQTLYEIQDGVRPGTYTSQMSGGGIFSLRAATDLEKVKTNLNFLEGFEVILYDRVNIFNDTTPRGKMAIQLLKLHPRIASSKNAINSTIHHFYVSEENEAMVERIRKQDAIDEAIAEKVTLFKKAGDYKAYQVASLCLHKGNIPVVKGQASPDLVKQSINNYLAEGKYQMSNVEHFMSLIEMLNTKEGKQRFEIKYLIQQAFNVRVLRAEDGFIFWDSKSGTKHMYKHNDDRKFENLILNDYLVYNPDEDQTNAYKDLLNEVIQKGGRVE